MTRAIHLVECAGRAMLRLATPSYRAAWSDEVVRTLRAACLDARRERGLSGLVFAGITELSNVGDSAVRSRFSRGPEITGGGRRAPSDGDGRRRPVLPRLRNDLRLAVRSLLATKVTAGIAVLTLALGIGVNAAVFSILDSTLFRPVPFPNADRYTEIWTLHLEGGFSTPRSRPGVLLEWRKQTDIFDRVEGYEMDSLVYDGARGAEMLTGSYVTPGLMPMLGVRPLAGRILTEGDGRADAPAVVVISEGFWRETMGRAADAVGQSLTLDGRPHQIVGIAPASFRFPNGAARFWIPHDAATGPQLVAFARRAPGVTADAAVQQVNARAASVVQAGGGPPTQSSKLNATFGVFDTKLKRSLAVLGGAVGFLLLIVCANLANLSLSRALARARDLAVRASLGASRRDLLRESLTEHALIGLAGAILGLGVAQLVISVTLDMLPEGTLIRSMNAIDLDGRTLLFTAAAGFTAALLFGLPPAWLGSRARVAEALKERSRSSAGSPAARRMRSGLVIAEVSLAIVLLVGAALMARSFVKLTSTDRGFDSTGLVTLRVGLPSAGFVDPYVRDAFTDAMIDRVRQMPGVRAATAGGVPPESSQISFGQVEFEDRPGEKTPQLILPVYQVWPSYFDVVGIPILEGRAFSETDTADAVIVSETFATKYFPSRALAVGARFQLGSRTWRTIVGVAGEVRQFDMDDSTGSFEFYYPLKRPVGVPVPPPSSRPDSIIEYRTIVARADDPATTAVRLRDVTHDVDPRVVVWTAGTVDRDFADAIARPRLVLLLMTVFAGMGLVLAAAGIYGVLSYSVAQRRREIGIRLALGAVPRVVGRLILGNGLKLTGVGIVLGVAAALALVRVMQSLLYEVEPSDPISVIFVVFVLLLTASFASWWPARRAMRLDPLALLREE